MWLQFNYPFTARQIAAAPMFEVERRQWVQVKMTVLVLERTGQDYRPKVVTLMNGFKD